MFMKKTLKSKKYLKVFDPLEQSVECSREESCGFFKSVESIRNTGNQRSPLGIIQNCRPVLEQNLWVEGDNKDSAHMDQLQQQITEMSEELEERNNKMHVLVEHMATLEFQNERLNRAKNNSVTAINEEVLSRIKSAFDQYEVQARELPDFHKLIQQARNSGSTQHPEQSILGLLSLAKRLYGQSTKAKASRSTEARCLQLVKLNRNLYQQNQSLRQEAVKCSLENSLQTSALMDTNFRTCRIMRLLSQKLDCQEVKDSASEYSKSFQRLSELNKTIQSLTKNLRKYQDSALNSDMEANHQALFQEQVTFKKNLIAREKQQFKDLMSRLADISASMEVCLTLRKPEQRKASPTTTFKNSMVFQKRGSLQIQSPHQDPGLTTRNKLFQKITGTKTERQMHHQTSLKQLKVKIESRSRKSTLNF